MTASATYDRSADADAGRMLGHRHDRRLAGLVGEGPGSRRGSKRDVLLAKLGFQLLARALPCLPVRTGIAAAPWDGCSCPRAALRAMRTRLLLLCLLLRSSWQTVEGDRHVGAAGVLHRPGGRPAVAVRVGVAGGVPNEQSRR